MCQIKHLKKNNNLIRLSRSIHVIQNIRSILIKFGYIL